MKLLYLLKEYWQNYQHYLSENKRLDKDLKELGIVGAVNKWNKERQTEEVERFWDDFLAKL